MGKHKHRSRSKSPMDKLDYRELDAAIFGIDPPKKSHHHHKSGSSKSRHRSRSRDRSHSRDEGDRRSRGGGGGGGGAGGSAIDYRSREERVSDERLRNERRGGSGRGGRGRSLDGSASEDDDGGAKSKARSKKRSSSSEESEDDIVEVKKRKAPTTAEEHLAAIQKMKEEKKLEKERMKALETPEEKRARRVAKKDSKALKNKQKSGWDEEYMGYSNNDNPFGDPNLLDTFVWAKKHKKSSGGPTKEDEIHRLQSLKQEETRNELEKVKKRRLEREKEREEREKEMELIQREKESEYYKEWEKQEDRFHLEQALLRSKIRIQNGRAKPIDLLAKYISAEEDELAIEMHEPYTYLNGLTIADLEDLIEDIKVYLELQNEKNIDYWKDITIICEEELAKLKRLDPTYHKRESNRREGINQAVSQDVSVVFKGKTYSQLQLLEGNIKDKLKGGEGVDVGYWESLLSQLRAFMARARLRERHQEVLKKKLVQLKEEQGVKGDDATAEDDDAAPSTSGADSSTPGAASSAVQADKTKEVVGEEEKDEDEVDESEVVLSMEDLEEAAYKDYESGGYSPPRITDSDKLLELRSHIITEEDDQKKLRLARQKLRVTGSGRLESAEDSLMKKAMAGMNDDDWNFGSELTLDNKAYTWSDKYRPRKPRYFNRVHTGFEWNKYNQTHYDYDNPPPKIVQGYKFNIFYPDLIDKTSSPEYTMTPTPDSRDFSVLRFTAGPPYEDIAFKVVNREWEYSYKHGFRCQFQNGIFQLWFHFKRYRYRR